jgi:tartrate dehydratase beta subunit/fumarate hydratase class I family protein
MQLKSNLGLRVKLNFTRLIILSQVKENNFSQYLELCLNKIENLDVAEVRVQVRNDSLLEHLNNQ